MQQTTVSYAQSHLREMCHQVIEDQDILLLTQEEAENVVMMPQSLFDAWQKQTQQQTLKIPKLNPLHYAKSPTEPFHAIIENKAELVFSDVEDSAAFAKKLRQQAWQRHE